MGLPQDQTLRDEVLDVYVGCHKCTHNVEESLSERLLNAVNETTKLGERIFRKGIKVLGRRFKNLNLDPIDYRQVIETYTGQKRTRYLKAVDNLLNGRVSRGMQRKIKVFIKKEKLPLGKPTRVIQGRTYEYNVQLGRFTKVLEKHIFGMQVPKEVNKDAVGKMFAVGMDDFEKAELIKKKWDALTDPVAITMDYSRYDSRVRKYQLHGEHSLYLKAFNNDRTLMRLLSYQINNVGKDYSGNISYKVEGTRATGEMNTLIGNSLINAAMLIGIAKYVGIKIDLMVCGDDSIIFVERNNMNKLLKAIKRYIVEMGHQLVYDTHYVLQKIKFCSSNPICLDDGRWKMIKDPIRTLSSYGFTAKHHHNIGGLSILKTISYAESICNRGIPLIGLHSYTIAKALENYAFKIGAFTDADLYGWKQRMGFGSKSPAEMIKWLKKMPLEYKEPSLLLRTQFDIAFNISSQFQFYIENRLKNFIIPDYSKIEIELDGCYGDSRA